MVQVFFHQRQDFAWLTAHSLPDPLVQLGIPGRPAIRFADREEDDAWRFKRRGYMRNPGIVADDEMGPGDQRSECAQGCLSGQVNDGCFHMQSHGGSQMSFLFSSCENNLVPAVG